MVTSVWETENNHKGINHGSRADDGAHTLIFRLKILVQQLLGELVHCLEEETNCLVLSTRAGHGESGTLHNRGSNLLLTTVCRCCLGFRLLASRFPYSLPTTLRVLKETPTMHFAFYTHNAMRILLELCVQLHVAW